MTKICQIWAEECNVAVALEDEFGCEKALNYLIGEKFLDFLDASDSDPDFRAEIPAFVAEIRTIFKRWQLADYLERARHLQPFDPSVFEDEESADFENQWDIRYGVAKLELVERAKEWLLGEGE
jgi:hypothetical protein